MDPISRRNVLTAAAAGTLATAVTAAGAQAGETMPQPRRAGVGGTNPGRTATRNFNRSVSDSRADAVIQASSHQLPVGMSTPS